MTDRSNDAGTHIEAEREVLADIRAAGFDVDAIQDLYVRGLRYGRAVPVLIDWLPRVDNPDVRQAIVRALAVPWAKPAAARPLITEYERETRTLSKWTVANSLSVVADDTVFDDVVRLLRIHEDGMARQMLVEALSNMRDPRAADVAIQMLGEDELSGHAIKTLRKLRAVSALPAIEPFLHHEKAWVRREARKAIERLTTVSKG